MKPQYLIKDGDDIQGWAYTVDFWQGLRTPFTNPMACIVTQIYVVPEHRGKGVATKLLTELTNDADSEKSILFLDFQPEEFGSDAKRLRKLYERFGFAWDETIGGMRREPHG